MPFLIALAAALLLTPLAIRAGAAAGLLDRPSPGPLKIHARPVPVTGGVAVVAAMLLALALDDAALGTGATAAALIALALGLADDARPLPTAVRLAVQGVAAGVLLSDDLGLDPLGPLADATLVLLAVALMNAVNLVDGQDGLAGGLTAIAALGLAALAATEDTATAAALALAAALAGFLVFNRPPARVFLGDGGAYAVGALLTAVAAQVVAAGDWQTLLGATACLGVLLFELVFTVARRAGSGALDVGDRLHSYDLWSARTGSRGRATLHFWAAAAACAAAGVAIAAAPQAAAAALALLLGAAALTFGRRLWITRP